MIINKRKPQYTLIGPEISQMARLKVSDCLGALTILILSDSTLRVR